MSRRKLSIVPIVVAALAMLFAATAPQDANAGKWYALQCVAGSSPYVGIDSTNSAFTSSVAGKFTKTDCSSGNNSAIIIQNSLASTALNTYGELVWTPEGATSPGTTGISATDLSFKYLTGSSTATDKRLYGTNSAGTVGNLFADVFPDNTSSATTYTMSTSSFGSADTFLPARAVSTRVTCDQAACNGSSSPTGTTTRLEMREPLFTLQDDLAPTLQMGIDGYSGSLWDRAAATIAGDASASSEVKVSVSGTQTLVVGRSSSVNLWDQPDTVGGDLGSGLQTDERIIYNATAGETPVKNDGTYGTTFDSLLCAPPTVTSSTWSVTGTKTLGNPCPDSRTNDGTAAGGAGTSTGMGRAMLNNSSLNDTSVWKEGLNTMRVRWGDYADTGISGSTQNFSANLDKNVVVDGTAPTNTPKTNCTGTVGTNGWYRSSVTCDMSASDASGADYVAGLSTASDAYTYYGTTGCTVGSPCTASSAPTSYSTSAQGTTTVALKTKDKVGNVAASYATDTIKIDSVNPTAGSITAPTYDTDGSFNVSFTGGSDATSGVSSDVLTREDGTLSGDVCSAYGSAGSSLGSSPVSQSLATGCYRYTLTTTDNAGNTTTTTATVKVDTSAPSAPSLTLSNATGNTYVSGTTAYINAQAGKSGGFDVAATTSDSQTGIKNVIFPLPTGFTSGNATDTSSPYSTTYAWSGAVAASGSQTVTATNNADNTNTSTFTVTPDTTAPTAGAITAPSYDGDGTFNVSFTGGSDSGSGVASNVLTRQTGTLSGDSCSSYGPASSDLGASPVSQSSLTTGCYRYTLTTTDNVGNTTTTTSVVKVDTSAPSSPSLTLSNATGNTYLSGTTAYINAAAGKSGGFDISATSTDAQSGIKNVIFPGLTGFTPPGDAPETDTSSPYSKTYSWSGAVAASGSQTVTATNNADGTATSTFTVTPDTANPTGGSISAPSYDGDGIFSVTWNGYTDAGSGIATNSVTRQAGTLSGDVCSSYGSATDITATSPISQTGLSTGCYRYTLTGTDNVGNTVSASTVVEVKVDTSAPSSPSLTLSNATGSTYLSGTTAYINAAAGKSGGFDISATSTDAQSGIKNIIFPALSGFSGDTTDTSSPYSTTYSWSGAVSASGLQTVTVTNNADDTNTSDFTVTPDTTAPSAGSITAPSYDTDGSYNVSFSGGSDSGSGVASDILTRQSATLSGDTCGTYGGASSSLGSSPVSQSGLSDGCYKYTLTTTDNVGNTTTTTSTVKVDSVAPSAPTLDNTFTDTSDTTPTWAFTGAEAGGTFECKIDSGSYSSCSSPYTASTLAEGSHTFSVRQIDAAGNVSAAASDTFVVDTTAPAAPTLDNTFTDTNDSTPTWAFTGAEAGGTYQCKIDSGVWASCSSPHTATSLADGSHTFYVRQLDAAGNVGSAASDAFVVDTASPSAPTLDNTFTDTSDTTPTWAFTGAEAGGTFQCKIDSGSYSSCSSPYTASALAEGSHTFSVRQIDAAGNAGAAASDTFTVDTTAPLAPTLTNTYTTTGDNTPTWAFTGAEAGGTYQCKIDSGSWGTCTSPYTASTLSDGNHTFYVRQVDAAGNAGAVEGDNIAVDAVNVDTAAPVVTLEQKSGQADPTNTSPVQFTISADEAMVSSTITSSDFTITNGTYASKSGSGSSYTINVTPSGQGAVTIAPSGSFSVDDDYGNAATTASGTDRSVTYDTVKPDANWQAPPSSPTKGSPVFTLIFTEAVSGVTSADFQNETYATATGCVFTPDASSGTTFHITVSGCSDGTLQPVIKVNTASDAAGNTGPASAQASEYIVMDSTAPTLSLAQASGQADPTNSSNIEFTLSANDSLDSATITSSDFTITNGTFSSKVQDTASSYTINVTASGQGAVTIAPSGTFSVADLAGNASTTASGADRSVTYDSTAPGAPTITSTFTDTNDTTPSISFTGEGGATFECKIDSGSYASCTSPYTSASLSEGSHTFSVRQTDAAGNTSSVATHTFTVDTTAPGAPSVTPVSPDPTNDSTPSIAFTGAEAGGTFQCKIDNGSYATCTSPYVPSTLADGSHTVYVRQIDAAGNTGSASTDTFTVDATAPAAPTLTTTPNDPTADSTPTFEWTGAEGGGTYECKVDSGSYSSCTSPYTHSSLADGSHTFYVRQVDGAGNNGTAETFTWTISTSGPSAPTLTASPNNVISSTTATFEFTGSGGTFQCKLGSGSWGSCSSPKVYNSLVDGHYTFRVRQTVLGLTSDPTVDNFVVDTDGYDSSDTSSAVNRQQFLTLEVNPTIEVIAVGADSDRGVPQPGGLHDTAQFSATVELRSNLAWTSTVDASNFSNMSIPIVVIGDGDTGPSNGGAGAGDGTQSYGVTFEQEISWSDDATPELTPNEASVDHNVSNSL